MVNGLVEAILRAAQEALDISVDQWVLERRSVQAGSSGMYQRSQASKACSQDHKGSQNGVGNRALRIELRKFERRISSDFLSWGVDIFSMFE